MIPYLTPAIFEAGGAMLIEEIAAKYPQFGWLASVPAEHFAAGLVVEICNLINAHTGAKPP